MLKEKILGKGKLDIKIFIVVLRRFTSPERNTLLAGDSVLLR